LDKLSFSVLSNIDFLGLATEVSLVPLRVLSLDGITELVSETALDGFKFFISVLSESTIKL
jgi:hypothetical protein